MPLSSFQFLFLRKCAILSIFHQNCMLVHWTCSTEQAYLYIPVYLSSLPLCGFPENLPFVQYTIFIVILPLGYTNSIVIEWLSKALFSFRAKQFPGHFLVCLVQFPLWALKFSKLEKKSPFNKPLQWFRSRSDAWQSLWSWLGHFDGSKSGFWVLKSCRPFPRFCRLMLICCYSPESPWCCIECIWIHCKVRLCTTIVCLYNVSLFYGALEWSGYFNGIVAPSHIDIDLQ